MSPKLSNQLNEQVDYVKSVEYYKKPLEVPSGAGRENADASRKKEIEVGLRVAEKKV